jgi:hypothetical protein
VLDDVAEGAGPGQAGADQAMPKQAEAAVERGEQQAQPSHAAAQHVDRRWAHR